MQRKQLRLSAKRIPVELQALRKSKNTHGITIKAVNENNMALLEATLPGPKNSPFESGIFKLSIQIVGNYPFHPPAFKFITPVFHPNIDTNGKICLDLLRLPPNGSYTPLLTLESILISVQLLLATPNTNDPLNKDASVLYKSDLQLYNERVKMYIQKYADSTLQNKEVPLECKESSKEQNEEVKLPFN